MTKRVHVDFWFDPFCPWAWIASRWITEVQSHREVTVDFHLAALAILDEEDPPPFLNDPDVHAKVWLALRVIAAAEQVGGTEAIGALYSAIGSRIHGGDNRTIEDLLVKDIRGIVEESLAEVGLPAELIRAGASAEFESSMRASIDRGLRVPGAIAGVPTLHFDGVAFFGPVLSSIPRGDDAVALWDAVITATRNPSFWELKRSQPDDLRPITN